MGNVSAVQSCLSTSQPIKLTCPIWCSDMPPWTLFLSLFIAFFFALPVGIVQAVTNQQGALNVISELIMFVRLLPLRASHAWLTVPNLLLQRVHQPWQTHLHDDLQDVLVQ